MFRIGKEAKAVLLITCLFILLCGCHVFWRFGGGGWYSVYTTRQETEAAVSVSTGEEEKVSETMLPGEKIDLNTAPAEELVRLPGIGEKKAQAIVAWREKHGPFKTIRQIMQVSGIGEGLYRDLKEYITVTP